MTAERQSTPTRRLKNGRNDLTWQPRELPDTTSIHRVGSYRPLQRMRTPPLTRRGVPIVVGSVPTKYCRSKTFSTPKKASRLRPMDRWAEKSTTLYLGSPGSVDAGYSASRSAAPGTTREFRSSSNCLPKNCTPTATLAYFG